MNAPVTLTPTLTVSEDGQLRYLPLETIDVQPGFNPRQFFADTEFQQLVASVRAQGIIQPIVVRPQQESPGRYWVIAGERRWRAAREARLPDMPALVRQVEERAALLLALAENGDRDGISPAEEAQAARRLLAACEGDRDEATRLLGWTPTKFAARQLLLHATPAVLTALAERRIKPGHAELLAGLPAPTQDGTLARVMADQISVADLKTRIAGFALDLAAAIFDKDECLACPHNSSVQAALFEEGIGEGRCQNRACYAHKTQAALAARKQALAGEYPAVFLDTEKAPGTYLPLVAAGPTGVGLDQATACRGCQHFGALLRSAPGLEGQVEADQCFNLTCHQDKQRTWRQAQASALTPAATAPTQGRPAAPPTTGRPAANIPPRKVEEAVDAFYRNTAAQLAEESAAASDTFVLYAVLKDAGFPNDLLQAAGLPVVGLSRATLLPALYALADTARNTLQRQAVAHLAARSALIGTPEQAERVNGAVALVATSGADLATRFRLDRVFLAAHTKAGIEALLSETRNSQGQTFKAWWIAAKGGDPAAFPKLLARKTEDLITTILSSGFDFTGFVPTVVARRVESLQPVLAASIAA